MHGEDALAHVLRGEKQFVIPFSFHFSGQRRRRATLWWSVAGNGGNPPGTFLQISSNQKSPSILYDLLPKVYGDPLALQLPKNRVALPGKNINMYISMMH